MEMFKGSCRRLADAGAAVAAAAGGAAAAAAAPAAAAAAAAWLLLLLLGCCCLAPTAAAWLLLLLLLALALGHSSMISGTLKIATLHWWLLLCAALPQGMRDSGSFAANPSAKRSMSATANWTTLSKVDLHVGRRRGAAQWSRRHRPAWEAN